MFLKVGDRAADDHVVWPNDDLALVTGPDGKRRFTHEDGRRTDFGDAKPKPPTLVLAGDARAWEHHLW